MHVDVSVVGFKRGGDNLTVFDGFAMPALLAEGVDDGVELSGVSHGREDERGAEEWEEFCVGASLF